MQTNKTTRELAIEWWNGLTTGNRMDFVCKYFPDNSPNYANKEQAYHIYLSEHPQKEETVPGKEVSNLFTGGEWQTEINHSRKAGNYPKTLITSNGKMVADCYNRDWIIGSKESEANAARIVLCHNVHDELVMALNDLLEYRQTPDRRSSDDYRNKYKEATNKAKELLNRIKG